MSRAAVLIATFNVAAVLCFGMLGRLPGWLFVAYPPSDQGQERRALGTRDAAY